MAGFGVSLPNALRTTARAVLGTGFGDLDNRPVMDVSVVLLSRVSYGKLGSGHVDQVFAAEAADEQPLFVVCEQTCGPVSQSAVTNIRA
jgi:hypothetical protein